MIFSIKKPLKDSIPKGLNSANFIRKSNMKNCLTIFSIALILILGTVSFVSATSCSPNNVAGSFVNMSYSYITEGFLHAENIDKGTHLYSNNTNLIYIGSNSIELAWGNVGVVENNTCYSPGDNVTITGYDNSSGYNKSVFYTGDMYYPPIGDYYVILISNEWPTLSDVTIDNTMPGTSDTILCDYTGYNDAFTPEASNNSNNVASSTANQAYYQWYKTPASGGRPVMIIEKTDNKTLNIGNDPLYESVGVNDYINCSVIVNDGLDNSTEYFSSNSAQVQGTGASFLTGYPFTNAESSDPVNVGGIVNFTASAKVDGGGNYSFYICDSNGDNNTECLNNPGYQLCSVIDNLNGSVVSCLHDSTGETTQESYTYHAYACDENDKCGHVQSQYHINHEESIVFDSPEILPSSPYGNDDLTCNYNFESTVDGDSDNSIVRWFNSTDGSNFAFSGVSGTYPTISIGSSHMKRGDYWLCEVTPRDSHGLEGSKVNSSAVEILNSPPQVEEYYFGSDPLVDANSPPTGTYTCPEPNVTDPDAGDTSFDYNYTWYRHDSSGTFIESINGQIIDFDSVNPNVDDRFKCGVDVCNEGTSVCSGIYNTTNSLVMIGAQPYYINSPAVEDGGFDMNGSWIANTNIDNPVTVGETINFSTIAEHPDDGTYRLLVCKGSDLDNCASNPAERYCESNVVSGENGNAESARCAFSTNSSHGEENYTYYAYVCDGALSPESQYCSAFYRDTFHLNHHPIGFDEVTITPPNPDSASDIVCGISGFNDPDWDDVQDAGASSEFAWYMAEGNVSTATFPSGFTLQPSYTSGHLGQGVVEKNETWVCEVTPVDRHGLSAGTPQIESTYTINAPPRAQSLPEIYVIDAASTESNRSEGEVYYGDVIGVNLSSYVDTDLDPEQPVGEAPDPQDPESRPHDINWQISTNPGAGVGGQTDADFVDITDNFDIPNITTGVGNNHGSVGDILRVCQGFYDGYDYNDLSMTCSEPFALSDPGKVKPSWIITPVDSWVFNRTEEEPSQTGEVYIVDASDDVPVTAGKDITFKATATHPDGQYDFIVCSNDSNKPQFDGVDFDSCNDKEFCRNENVNASEEAKCSYTTKAAENTVHWKAYICNRDDNTCNLDNARSPYVVNHRPDLSVRHPAFGSGEYSNEDGYDIAVSPGEDNLTKDSEIVCDYHLRGDHEQGFDIDGDEVQLDRYVWYKKSDGEENFTELSYTGETLPTSQVQPYDQLKCSVRVYNHISGDNGANVTVTYDVFSPERLSDAVTIVPDTVKPVINSTFESFAYIPSISNCDPLNPRTGVNYNDYPEFSISATDNGNVSYVNAKVTYPNSTVISLNSTSLDDGAFQFSLSGYDFIPGEYEVEYYAEDTTGLRSDIYESSFEVVKSKIISGSLRGLEYPVNSTIKLQHGNNLMHKATTDGDGYYEICVFDTELDLQFDTNGIFTEEGFDDFNNMIKFYDVDLTGLSTIPMKIETISKTEVNRNSNGLSGVVSGIAINTTLTNHGKIELGYKESNVDTEESSLVSYTCRDWLWSDSVKKCVERYKPMYSEVNVVRNKIFSNMQEKDASNSVAFIIATEPKRHNMKHSNAKEPSLELLPGGNYSYQMNEHGLNIQDADTIELLKEVYMNYSEPGGNVNKMVLFKNLLVGNENLDVNSVEVASQGDLSFDLGVYDESTSNGSITISSIGAGKFENMGVMNTDAFANLQCGANTYDYEEVFYEWENISSGELSGFEGNFGFFDEGVRSYEDFESLKCGSLETTDGFVLSNMSETGSTFCVNHSGKNEKLYMVDINNSGALFLKGDSKTYMANLTNVGSAFCVDALGDEYKLYVNNWTIESENVGTYSIDVNNDSYIDFDNRTVENFSSSDSDLNYISSNNSSILQPINGMLSVSSEDLNCRGANFSSDEFNLSSASYCLRSSDGKHYKISVSEQGVFEVNEIQYNIESLELYMQRDNVSLLINNASKGDYDFYYRTFYLNGTEKISEEWAASYDKIQVGDRFTDSDGVGVPAVVNMYRPGDNITAHSFVADHAEGFNISVYNRTYDVEISMGNYEFTLFNSNYDMLENIEVEHLLERDVSDSDIYRNFVGGFAIDGVNQTSAQLRFYYGDEDGVSKPSDMAIFKCNNWNFDSRRCDSRWGEQGGRLVQDKNMMYANVDGFSGYVLLEKDVAEEEQKGRSSSSSANDPANREIYEIYNRTKDMEGELNETKELAEKSYEISTNISERQIKQVGVDTSEISKQMHPGEIVTTKLHVENNKRDIVDITASAEGKAAEFFSFTNSPLTLRKGQEANFGVSINVPSETKPNLYSGWVVLEADNGEETKIPVEIRVVEATEKQLQLQAQPLQRSYAPGRAVKLEVNMLNPQSKPLDVQLEFEMYNVDTGKVVLEKEVNVGVESSVSKVLELNVDDNIELGKYIIRINAFYVSAKGQDMQTPASTFVNIQHPWYSYQLFGMLPIWIVLLVVLLASMMTGGYEYYVYRREKAKKYKMMVDYSTLPQPSKKSAFVGHIAETNVRTFVNLEDLKTHAIIAGATGGGKSVAAQVMVEEALRKNVSVIVFDPTAQWSGFLRKCNEKRMLKYYPKFGLKKKQAQAFSGNIHAIEDARELIDVQKYIKPGEITIFTTNKLDPKDVDILIANTIRQVFRSNLEESSELKLLLVYDEVHRLLPKFGGSGAGFLQIERACREFRKWGVGLLLISQVLSDFIGSIKANISTEVQVRTRDEGDLERLKTKYGEDILKSVVKASVGTGMLENAQYNKGRAYFVDFRPLLHSVTRLSDEELEKYNKYNSEIDELKYQLEQLEEMKIDVFDLQLELKLASDKVKSGNFNMVDIYLEGLKPRVKAEWERLGKKPKKLEKKLVSEEDLQESIRQAQVARQQYEKKNEGQNKSVGVVKESNGQEISKKDSRDKLEEDKKKIRDYVKMTIEKGFKNEQVKGALKKQGWKDELIDSVIQEVRKINNNVVVQKENQLRPVVKRLLSKGYSKDKVRNLLIKKGYNSKDVEDAFK